MPRADLLSLSLDDLATLANRGLVKRAQAELDGESITYTLSENAAGTVSVLWSDDVHCLLPSGAPLQGGKCSCSATGLCRHLLRSVLAYQRENAAAETPEKEREAEIETPVSAPAMAWNPGEIPEDALSKVVPAAVLTQARKIWDAGQLIEVTLSAKPTARFHTLATNTRFMVPGDARYTHCDCAGAAPCVHVPLAVWAFQQLKGEAHGLISTRTERAPVPASTLDEVETALGELARIGVAGAGRPFLDRLTRLEGECRAQGLVWPGGIAADLSRQIELHMAHNARFEPVRVASLAGELLMRCDAIRSQTGATPEVFVRGAASDVTTEVGAARLIGIGTQARLYRGGAELSAWLQDTDSGALVYVSRDFPDPKPDPGPALLRGSNAPTAPQSLARLANSPVVKGTGIGALGSGQILARGGKRAPDGEFSFGRTPLSFNAQTFEWQRLRAPLLCEGFSQINAHFEGAAPTPLRPRRAGEDFFVVPLAGVEDAHFSQSQQETRAVLRDTSGETALLIHPFSARGASGTQALLAALDDPDSARFVAGRFSRGAQGLTVSPLSLVCERGGARVMIQPWVSQNAASPNAQSDAQFAPKSATQSAPLDPLRDFSAQLGEALGELWLLGLARADEAVARDWARLAGRGAALGFGRLVAPIETLSAELALQSKVRQWDFLAAKNALFEAAVLALLLDEVA